MARSVTEEIVHHATEVATFLILGTCATNPYTAVVGYGSGKLAYLIARRSLDEYMPQLPLDRNRQISWAIALIAGGIGLHVASQLTGLSIDTLTAIGTIAGVTLGSIVIRNTVDYTFKRIIAVLPSSHT